MILGPSGENIYPEEIESIINGHWMVSESVVTESKGKLVARVYLNPDRIKALKEAKEEAIAAYYETKENFSKTKDELMHSYDEKREEVIKAFNEKLEQIKKEISEYVNSRVNKFSKISSVHDHPEQFEKTATHKIKRYKYTEPKK